MKLTENDVTPESVFFNRRKFMGSSFAATTLIASGTATSVLAQDLSPNSYDDITSYNNYYEFGTGKEDPKKYASSLVTSPWSVEISGMVDNPGVYSFEQIISGKSIEERIYRLRCVEAWSMVVPWNGFQLSTLLSQIGVKSGAKYVQFETAALPKQMPGLSRGVLDWPYTEGLRLDEAMNPLAFIATGIYGKPIPNQNGAPLRLVVPWKYGFKSIKSIVKITLTDKQPLTSWEKSAPSEYGFYANVNPNVDHPRWSQATERRVGGGLFSSRQDTLPFNGYGAEVASLYSGMDLQRFF
jgi:sulfoxide reductase catalytic subunit YedY